MQPPNKVNLSNPSKSIMINLIKGTCGAAVVEDFRALNKYNIKQIANPESEGKAKEKGAVEEAKEEETKPEEDSKEWGTTAANVAIKPHDNQWAL